MTAIERIPELDGFQRQRFRIYSLVTVEYAGLNANRVVRSHHGRTEDDRGDDYKASMPKGAGVHSMPPVSCRILPRDLLAQPRRISDGYHVTLHENPTLAETDGMFSAITATPPAP